VHVLPSTDSSQCPDLPTLQGQISVQKPQETEKEGLNKKSSIKFSLKKVVDSKKTHFRLLNLSSFSSFRRCCAFHQLKIHVFNLFNHVNHGCVSF